MNQRNAMWIGGGLLAVGAVVLLMGPGRAPMKRAGRRLGDSMHGMRGRMSESMHGMRGRVSESMQGMRERARGVFHRERPDEVLEERVEGAISRHISRPGAVGVDCNDGECIVSGEVRAQELSTVARTVQSIPGVESVRTEVRQREDADRHPGPHLA